MARAKGKRTHCLDTRHKAQKYQGAHCLDNRQGSVGINSLTGYEQQQQGSAAAHISARRTVGTAAVRSSTPSFVCSGTGKCAAIVPRASITPRQAAVTCGMQTPVLLEQPRLSRLALACSCACDPDAPAVHGCLAQSRGTAMNMHN